jgi:ferredoxin-nitrate reductase
VELAAADAEALGIAEGDLVRVESARGHLEAPARVTGSRRGVVFAPFHYGYWERIDDVSSGASPEERRPTAANELTLTAWDPVSKQPQLKLAAVSVRKVTP